MTKQIEALRLALEALESLRPAYGWGKGADQEEAITAIREALADQPAQPQYPLPDDLYDSKDWREGSYSEKVAWLHTMYEGAKKTLDDYLEHPAQQQEPVAMSIIEQALNMPLDDFTKLLGMRPRNCIRANMWSPFETDEHLKPPHTVRHLMMFSRKEMARWPNLGKKSLNEIEENLRSLGLQLWHEHDERSLKPLMEAPVQAQERKPLTDGVIRLAKVALHEMPRPVTDWHEAAKRVCQAVVYHGIKEQP